MSRDVFDARPDGFMYTLRSFGKKLGLIFNDGPSWSKTRRVALKYLKSFGYGTRSMEHHIAEECAALVRAVEAAPGPVLVNNMFNIPVVNIVWRLVAGKRYELDDERLKNLCDLINRCFRATDMSGGVMTFMPFLRHVIPDLIGYTEMTTVHRALHEFLEETIQEHKERIDLKNPKDVIDAFLVEIENKEEISLEELQVVCLDMLEAGVETTSNTAVFMVLHLARAEAAQRRLQSEIDEVVGRDRAPSMADRPRMVYTEAVIMETLRISSIAPVGVPRMTLADAKLGNYMIPKGTFVLLSIHDLHNGDHWEDPDVFRPERFLTKEGNLVQNEWLSPFGSGKRRCLGEGLARSELFMFLTHLMQKFTFKIPEGDPMPSTEPVDGLSLSAKPFKILFEPRALN